jgi:cell division protein FtsN
MKKPQRGGTIVGFILGLLVGLAAALAVAVYVTKVPIPFVNKIKSRALDKDEVQRNKNWDINAPLTGKSAAQPGATPAPDKPAAAAPGPGAASDDPLGDLARARAGAAPAVANAPAAPAPAAAADAYGYFVQAGAFRTEKDADAQRAKLAMLGWEARVSEREQSGRVVYRVRVGPFAKRDDAEVLKGKLEGAGVESNLVRVQR